MDLVFPGKKPKELIEDHKDDDIDAGKKKKDDDVKVNKLNMCIFSSFPWF